MDNSVMMCDEILQETKIVPTNFNKNKATFKTQNFYILLVFVLIIDSCQYLLLSDKISSKTKTFITISHHR